jgi:hypothetical protein
MVLISEAQERERGISYFHKPIVQGWTTPSSWRSRWRRCWGRWRPHRQGSAGVVLLQSTAPGLCFMFLCSSPPPRDLIRGAPYIGVFRSRQSRGRKMDGIGASRAEIGGPTRPGTGPAWAILFWPSGLRSFASLAPKSSPVKILTFVKFQLIWTSFGSLKHQNIEMGVF